MSEYIDNIKEIETAESVDSQIKDLEHQENLDSQTTPESSPPSNNAIIRKDNLLAGINLTSSKLTGKGLSATPQDRRIDLLSPIFKSQFKGPSGGNISTMKFKQVIPAKEYKAIVDRQVKTYMSRKQKAKLDILKKAKKEGGLRELADGDVTLGTHVKANEVKDAGLNPSIN